VTAFAPDAELPAMSPLTTVQAHTGRRGAAFRPAGTQARQVASMDSGKSAFAALTAAVTLRGVDGTGQASLTSEQRLIVTRFAELNIRRRMKLGDCPNRLALGRLQALYVARSLATLDVPNRGSWRECSAVYRRLRCPASPSIYSGWRSEHRSD
jgi:hypothetical protein